VFHWETRQDSKDSDDIGCRTLEGYLYSLHFCTDTCQCHRPPVSAIQENSAFLEAHVAQISHDGDSSCAFHGTPWAQLYVSHKGCLQ